MRLDVVVGRSKASACRYNSKTETLAISVYEEPSLDVCMLEANRYASKSLCQHAVVASETGWRRNRRLRALVISNGMAHTLIHTKLVKFLFFSGCCWHVHMNKWISHIAHVKGVVSFLCLQGAWSAFCSLGWVLLSWLASCHWHFGWCCPCGQSSQALFGLQLRSCWR